MNEQEAWQKARYMHPLILGLVARLPQDGEPFPPRKRAQWLEAMRLSLEVLYADLDEEASQEAGDA